MSRYYIKKIILGEEDAIVGAVLPGEERQEELQGTPGCAQVKISQLSEMPASDRR